MRRGVLAITPGDPDGIGPEVTWKAIRKLPSSFRHAVVCVGARAPFDRLRAPVTELSDHDLADRAALSKKILRARSKRIWLVPAPSTPHAQLSGFQSGWSIERAVALIQRGIADALVTGPISKERLNQGGFPYPGHTEFLAQLSAQGGSAPPVTMMLANDQLRVSLVTVHLPLAKVAASLRGDEIRRAIDQTVLFLRERLGIKKPRIAVAALNPHAGEGGMLGDEEARIIVPAVQAMQTRSDAQVSGPYPADTLFALAKYDAIVCMYHDQGLIPVKLLDFKNTVNITLGLPWVRTSVDHGVAFDIAGKNKADPASMRAAIALAARIS
jgi:4-hydroxythreonine-4-phosphate dehydrogenase